MAEFLDKDFLLTNSTAQELYFNHAAKMPIVDYHSHINPKEIFENRKFENITQLWLEADHYKWRLMRINGVDERYITGSGADRDKFNFFVKALERAVGNPMYHWCHLELKNYFGFSGVINTENANYIWDLCKEKLQREELSVQGIIKSSSVRYLATTDECTSHLKWHKELYKKPCTAKVLPTFRPDKIFNIENKEWLHNIKELEKATNTDINSLKSLKEALLKRIEYFKEGNCVCADHGFDVMPFYITSEEKTEQIFQKAVTNKKLSQEETKAFKTNLLIFCAGQYAINNWAMQLHFSCSRNSNTRMYESVGTDSGFDCIHTANSVMPLTQMLNFLEREKQLPRTIIYSLNPTDNTPLNVLAGAFCSSDGVGKIQQGAAWWFNDSKLGITEQLQTFASLYLLGNFIGMLTDSRSFLSYSRHEYFRRILCNMLGKLIEEGEYPYTKSIGQMVEDISYNNTIKYFRLEEK